MADDAKNPTADNSVDEKGQAKDETNSTEAPETAAAASSETPQPKKSKPGRKPKKPSTKASATKASSVVTEKVAEIPEAEVVKDAAEKSDKTAETAIVDAAEDNAKDTESKSASATDADFQAAVRDQIENCKFEIVAALQESVHSELKNVMQGQIRKSERRRVFGVVVRDILILILIVIAGFFAYRLYEYGEFPFLHPSCEQSNSCDNQPSDPEPEPEPEEIKDLAWYRKNYGNLFDNLQTQLDADKVSAYYLYSGDYKVDEIAPEYLLSMAYNQLNTNYYYTETGLAIPADAMRTAFTDTFGSADNFTKKSFTHGCTDFNYDKTTDTFATPNLACTNNSTRKILEEITEIYEEGNVLYFLTVATIYDQSENAYYTFDNLFRPAITNVTEADLATHASLLNKYQYQFKRTDDDRFYFSSIIKLK